MGLLKLRDRLPTYWFEDDLAAGGKPSDETLAKINAMDGVLEPLNADEIIVFGNGIANDRPFKDGRRVFRQRALPQIAALLPGTKGIANHAAYGDQRDPRPLARTFEAGVTKDAQGTSWVLQRAWMIRDPFSEAIFRAIKGGHVTELSLGIYFGTLDCSICGEGVNEWRGSCPNDHQPGAMYDGKTCLWEIDDIKAVDEWSMLQLEGMVNGTYFFLAAGKQMPQDAVALDDIEARFAKRPAPPELKGFDKLFPAHATLRRERREKFQSFMKHGEGSPAPQSGA